MVASDKAKSQICGLPEVSEVIEAKTWDDSDENESRAAGEYGEIGHGVSLVELGPRLG